MLMGAFRVPTHADAAPFLSEILLDGRHTSTVAAIVARWCWEYEPFSVDVLSWLGHALSVQADTGQFQSRGQGLRPYFVLAHVMLSLPDSLQRRRIELFLPKLLQLLQTVGKRGLPLVDDKLTGAGARLLVTLSQRQPLVRAWLEANPVVAALLPLYLRARPLMK